MHLGGLHQEFLEYFAIYYRVRDIKKEAGVSFPLENDFKIPLNKEKVAKLKSYLICLT